MSLMTENRLRHLPVLDEGTLVAGSIGDLVKDIISEQQFIIEQLEHTSAGSAVIVGGGDTRMAKRSRPPRPGFESRSVAAFWRAIAAAGRRRPRASTGTSACPLFPNGC